MDELLGLNHDRYCLKKSLYVNDINVIMLYFSLKLIINYYFMVLLNYYFKV